MHYRKRLWSPLSTIVGKAQPMTFHFTPYLPSSQFQSLFSHLGTSYRLSFSPSYSHDSLKNVKVSSKSFCSQSIVKIDATIKRCWNCDTIANGTVPFLYCSFCQSIQPVDSSVDYFRICGQEIKYEIEPDGLEGKYKDCQKKLHPNLVHSKPEMKLEGVDVSEVKTVSDLKLFIEDLEEVRRILSSSNDWCIVEETLDRCSIQFTPELVVEILRKNTLHGKAALNFFSWVAKQVGYRHTTETYNMAIKISGCGKDFKNMRRLFYEMRRRGCLTSDTWAIMIMQYGRTGLTDIALRTFTEMKTEGFNPTASSYKYLIISLSQKKGRKVDKAIKSFQEMIRAGCIPDKELLETYLGCLCEVGKLLEARSCADSLPKVGFTAPLSYSLYVRALCRAGRLNEALEILDNIETEKSTLDQYVYGSLVHGLLRTGQVEQALAKVNSMKQAGIYPTVHVYTTLIAHFFKEKQIQRALGIIARMEKEGCQPTIVTYSAMIRGYMNMEKAAEAWNVFNHLRLNGPKPDFMIFSMFINCLCRIGRSEEAMQLLFEMRNTGIVPSSVNFRAVVYGLNREGKQDLAQIVLQQKSALKSARKFLI